MWSESRKVQIVIPPEPRRNGGICRVTFTIPEGKRKIFDEVLNKFLDYCSAINEESAFSGMVEGFSKITSDEILDSETHEPCKLIITIQGHQDFLVQGLRQNMQAFAFASDIQE